MDADIRLSEQLKTYAYAQIRWLYLPTFVSSLNSGSQNVALRAERPKNPDSSNLPIIAKMIIPAKYGSLQNEHKASQISCRYYLIEISLHFWFLLENKYFFPNCETKNMDEIFVWIHSRFLFVVEHWTQHHSGFEASWFGHLRLG